MNLWIILLSTPSTKSYAVPIAGILQPLVLKWQSQKTVYATVLDFLGELDLWQNLCLIMAPSILTLQSELGS